MSPADAIIYRRGRIHVHTAGVMPHFYAWLSSTLLEWCGGQSSGRGSGSERLLPFFCTPWGEAKGGTKGGVKAFELSVCHKELAGGLAVDHLYGRAHVPYSG
jgi:hypothetical protein